MGALSVFVKVTLGVLLFRTPQGRESNGLMKLSVSSIVMCTRVPTILNEFWNNLDDVGDLFIKLGQDRFLFSGIFRAPKGWNSRLGKWVAFDRSLLLIPAWILSFTTARSFFWPLIIFFSLGAIFFFLKKSMYPGVFGYDSYRMKDPYSRRFCSRTHRRGRSKI